MLRELLELEPVSSRLRRVDWAGLNVKTDGTAWEDIWGNRGEMVSGRILKILVCPYKMHRFRTTGTEIWRTNYLTQVHLGNNYHTAHTNVRRGPFSHTRSQDFLWGCFSGGALFFPHKADDLFLVVVTFKPWWAGAPSHGTTGTMINPALRVLCF